MKQYLQLAMRFWLLLTPAIACSMLTASPSQAATFASSQGLFNFTNFSQSPFQVITDTNTQTLAIAESGMVKALADAEAFFITTPPLASNSSLSQAFGKNRDYLGIANSQASVIGFFDVDAGKDFSFDFLANLNLFSSIDNPPAENARASGDISFALIDVNNNKILDLFSLAGNVVTEGNNDFVAYQNSANITLNNPSIISDFGGKQEFAQASIQGSLNRSFSNNTKIALIEVKRNRVRVAVPEPSTNIALLLSAIVIGARWKRQQKVTPNIRKQAAEV